MGFSISVMCGVIIFQIRIKNIFIYKLSDLRRYLLLIHTSWRGFFQTGYFTTDIYNALQISLFFLTDVLNKCFWI